MPIPVSRTQNSRQLSSASCDWRRTLSSTAPRSVNLTALPARLKSTCRNRTWSPTRASGVPAAWQEKASRFSPARTERTRAVWSNPPQAEGGRFQLQFAGLDLRRVQQVVQQRQEQVGRSLGGLQAVLDGRVGGLGQGHVDHAQDGVHGRAQLVAHAGQELALGRAGGLRGGLGFAQGGLRVLAVHGIADRPAQRPGVRSAL